MVKNDTVEEIVLVVQRHLVDKFVKEGIKEWDGLDGRRPCFQYFIKEYVYQRQVENGKMN